MATFIEIRYIARGQNEENFTVEKETYEHPWHCYINLDVVERITPILNNDNFKIVDNGKTSIITAKYFIIHTIANHFFVLKEEEYYKVIQNKNSL